MLQPVTHLEIRYGADQVFQPVLLTNVLKAWEEAVAEIYKRNEQTLIELCIDHQYQYLTSGGQQRTSTMHGLVLGNRTDVSPTADISYNKFNEKCGLWTEQIFPIGIPSDGICAVDSYSVLLGTTRSPKFFSFLCLIRMTQATAIAMVAELTPKHAVARVDLPDAHEDQTTRMQTREVAVREPRARAIRPRPAPLAPCVLPRWSE